MPTKYNTEWSNGFWYQPYWNHGSQDSVIQHSLRNVILTRESYLLCRVTGLTRGSVETPAKAMGWNGMVLYQVWINPTSVRCNGRMGCSRVCGCVWVYMWMCVSACVCKCVCMCVCGLPRSESGERQSKHKQIEATTKRNLEMLLEIAVGGLWNKHRCDHRWYQGSFERMCGKV